MRRVEHVHSLALAQSADLAADRSAASLCLLLGDERDRARRAGSRWSRAGRTLARQRSRC